ncbi:MAG: D-alanyl-D-alanine carboxypeptidase [Clostridiales bacterium]|nr:D-alanyl-D-alanine carboxypeptidase [Clostridiales bacterium]
MKNNVKYLIISFIISFILFNIKIDNTYAYTQSKGECVIEVNSGRIVHELNGDKKLEMASTTKILTALTVIENFDLDKEITVSKNSVGIEGSSIYLREGEKLTVKELLYGLMLRSGNDAAECLASSLVNRDDFIKLMNKTASLAGATNSNFTNPHGLHAENHYTTAIDLAKITLRAMKNPKFKEIVSTKKINVSNDGYDYDRVFINKNKLLFSYDGCNGVKTGYTKNAGRCLVTSAYKNGLEFISVVLNSPQMWERSRELLDGSFSTYQNTLLVSAKEYEDKIFYDVNGNPYQIVMPNNFSYPISNVEKELITFKFDGKTQEEFSKNLKKQAIFEIFLQNKLIFSQNIFIIK